MKVLVDLAALNALRKAITEECAIHSPVYAAMVRLQSSADEQHRLNAEALQKSFECLSSPSADRRSPDDLLLRYSDLLIDIRRAFAAPIAFNDMAAEIRRLVAEAKR